MGGDNIPDLFISIVVIIRGEKLPFLTFLTNDGIDRSNRDIVITYQNKFTYPPHQ